MYKSYYTTNLQMRLKKQPVSRIKTGMVMNNLQDFGLGFTYSLKTATAIPSIPHNVESLRFME